MMQAVLRSNKALAQSTFSLLVTAVCVALIWNQLRTLSFVDVSGTFTAITASQWLGALLATVFSFRAIGYYDDT